MKPSPHNSRKHAPLSPSGAERWFNCPGSIRQSQGIEEEPSPYADEGTKAHELAEYCLKNNIAPYIAAGDYPVEMREYVKEYVDFVKEEVTQGAKLYIEKRVSPNIPDIYGTVDALILKDNLLQVIDLKYGKGVLVDAFENKQLLIYAYSAFVEYELCYDFKEVEIIIVQPRRESIIKYRIPIAQLKEFGEMLKEKVMAALDPNALIIPGKMQCKWCLAKGKCKPRADYNLKIAQEDFKNRLPEWISLREFGDLLPKLDELIAWANDVKKQALKLSLHGEIIPGYKLVEGRSVRRWKDNAEEELLDILVESDLYTKKLVGIPKIEKKLGKKHPILEKIIEKPTGRPVLVPDADKRKEVSIAELDFKGV